MRIHTIATPSLGDRSHVIVDGDNAVVIDPQRDVDRVLDLVRAAGASVTDVLETHVHNDYVSGGPELAQRCGARYHVHADAGVEVEHVGLVDGDLLPLGDGHLRAVHTPGHTPHHLAYVLQDDGRDVAVFTGGSMLYGSVGRTDLVADVSTEQLTRDQHRSVRRLATMLSPDTEVRPTHGFGSFCSSGETTAVELSTIGRERRENQALRTDDEDAFVGQLLAGLDDHPAYYTHMAPMNRQGPAPVDLSPVTAVDVPELRRRVHAGEWVVDLRTRTAFGARHLTGTVNVELADAASTYLAWIIPWGTPVTLVADTSDDVAAMQRQLVRVGIDRPAGRHTDGLDDVAGDDGGSYPVADFDALRRVIEAGEHPWVLDARRDTEWGRGHIVGSHHVPLHELLSRIDEVPRDQPVWVHCASGYRASIAASLLARSGRAPVLVDGHFDDEARPVLDIVTDGS